MLFEWNLRPSGYFDCKRDGVFIDVLSEEALFELQVELAKFLDNLHRPAATAGIPQLLSWDSAQEYGDNPAPAPADKKCTCSYSQVIHHGCICGGK
jgi:hypothetical protein